MCKHLRLLMIGFKVIDIFRSIDWILSTKSVQKLSNGWSVIPPFVWFYWWVLCASQAIVCLFVSNRMVFTLATTYKYIIHIIPAVYRPLLLVCVFQLWNVDRPIFHLTVCRFAHYTTALCTRNRWLEQKLIDLYWHGSFFVSLFYFYLFYYFVSIEFFYVEWSDYNSIFLLFNSKALSNRYIYNMRFFSSVIDNG